MRRPSGAAISTVAWAWVFQFSAGVPANPMQAGAGWYFDSQADCEISPPPGYKRCSVNYLITTFGGLENDLNELPD